MARSTHSRFSSLNPLRFSSLVRTSVSNRLRVLAPAACFSSARRADHGLHRGVLGQPLGIVGVFIPCQAAIDRLAQ